MHSSIMLLGPLRVEGSSLALTPWENALAKAVFPQSALPDKITLVNNFNSS